VFRVQNPVTRYSHAYSSTYLKIESGRGLFRLEGKETFEAGEGDLVFWQRDVDHEVIDIIEGPLIFFSRFIHQHVEVMMCRSE
jgi:quercetin dioxygenase-like cupin family protein